MSHDGVAPGEDHDDSPWRPDAAATFEHPPRRAFAVRPARDDVPPPPPDRPTIESRTVPAVEPPPRSRTSVAVAAGVGAIVTLAIAGSVVVGSDPTVPPVGGVAVESDGAGDDLGSTLPVGFDDTSAGSLAACSGRRLPTVVDPLWSTELTDVRRLNGPIQVGEETAVAIVGLDPQAVDGSGLAVVAIDLDDGAQRWRVDLRSSSGEHAIVGIVDSTVIVKSAAGPETGFRRLFGFDEETGQLLWDRGFRGDWTPQVDEATGLVYVGVRRPVATTEAETEVELISARDGDRLHVAAGAIVGVDPDGRLITRRGDKVLATSPSARDLLGVVEPSDAPFVLLGADVLVAHGNGNELSRFSGSGDAQVVTLAAPAGTDPPAVVVGLESLGNRSLLVTGGGFVHGVQVGEVAAKIRWSLPGIVVESAASDRGRSLLVASDGGAQQSVIDAATGREIVDVELRPGSLATLEMAANGVVLQDVVDGVPSRTAFDLDGRALWSLEGSGPVTVGRNLVLTVENADESFRVGAFGDGSPVAGPAGCGGDQVDGASTSDG